MRSLHKLQTPSFSRFLLFIVQQKGLSDDHVRSSSNLRWYFVCYCSAMLWSYQVAFTCCSSRSILHSTEKDRDIAQTFTDGPSTIKTKVSIAFSAPRSSRTLFGSVLFLSLNLFFSEQCLLLCRDEKRPSSAFMRFPCCCLCCWHSALHLAHGFLQTILAWLRSSLSFLDFGAVSGTRSNARRRSGERRQRSWSIKEEQVVSNL